MLFAVERMTPAERFVVVAGASLLVFNLILFSLCISLVFDSKAARNDTAKLIDITSRLLENQQALAIQEANSLEGAKSAEGCPLPTVFQTEVPATPEVTEVALSTQSDIKENRQEPRDAKETIKSLEERIGVLEKLVEDLRKEKEGTITTQPTILRRKRNGEGRSSLLS